MRRRRADRRGLAEIVGTLMLVLIVVAAAVAFSLFLASYQSEVQREQQAAHNRSLEGLHLVSVVPQGVSNGTYLGVTVHFVSADINPMNLTSLLLNGLQVVSWKFDVSGGPPTSCSWPTADPKNCTVVPPLAPVAITLYPPVNVTLSETSHLEIEFFTQLSNAFRFQFAPPVAIASYHWVSGGGRSLVVFDGTQSLQPAGGDNASLVAYAWSCQNVTHNKWVNGSGPLFEPPAQTSSNNTSLGGFHLFWNYTISLQVTNSDGLLDSVEILYLGL